MQKPQVVSDNFQPLKFPWRENYEEMKIDNPFIWS